MQHLCSVVVCRCAALLTAATTKMREEQRRSQFLGKFRQICTSAIQEMATTYGFESCISECPADVCCPRCSADLPAKEEFVPMAGFALLPVRNGAGGQRSIKGSTLCGYGDVIRWCVMYFIGYIYVYRFHADLTCFQKL